MRGLSQLYSHECVINDCETNSRMVEFFLHLDQLDANAANIKEAVASLPEFVTEIVPRFVGAEPVEVDLSGNYFGDRGLAAIVKVLLTMTRVTKVHLRKVKLQEKGVEALCHLMQRHPNLREVDVRGNELYATSGRVLTDMLRKSPNIVIFLVDMHAMPSRISRKLAAQIGRNMALQYKLKTAFAQRERGWGDGIDHKAVLKAAEALQEEWDAEAAAVAAAAGASKTAPPSPTKASEDVKPKVETAIESEKKKKKNATTEQRSFVSTRRINLNSSFDVDNLCGGIEGEEGDAKTRQREERPQDVLEYLRTVVNATESELALVEDMLGKKDLLDDALECYNRCGSFAAQLVADFGIDGSALQALTAASNEVATVHFLPSTTASAAVGGGVSAATTPATTAIKIPTPPPPKPLVAVAADSVSNPSRRSSSRATQPRFGATIAPAAATMRYGCGLGTVDPLDIVFRRVRQLAIARGLGDPLYMDEAPLVDPQAEQEAEEREESSSTSIANRDPLHHQDSTTSASDQLPFDNTISSASGIDDFLKQLVKAKQNRLVLHKIEDLHRRMIYVKNAMKEWAALVAEKQQTAIAKEAKVEQEQDTVTTKQPEEVEAEIHQLTSELIDLLVHTWEAIAMTTIDNAPLLEDFETAIYTDQRTIVTDLYQSKRHLLLLCDQCRYFKRDPHGAESIQLASNRYDACRGALRSGDVSAFIEEVIFALRSPKASHRRELAHQLQSMLPAAFVESWVRLRLSRGVAKWIKSRYLSDFVDMPTLGGVAPRTNEIAACVERGLFYDVAEFPGDLIEAFGGVGDQNALVVLCRQHAAAARYNFLAEKLLPQVQ